VANESPSRDRFLLGTSYPRIRETSKVKVRYYCTLLSVVRDVSSRHIQKGTECSNLSSELKCPEDPQDP